MSGAPYGYRYIPRADGGGDARYEIVVEEARVVRQLFHWVGQDRLTVGEVQRRLEAAGERTRTGKTHWDRNTIRRMLRNPAYTGAAAFGRTRSTGLPATQGRPARWRQTFPRGSSGYEAVPPAEWITIPVPAIVSADLFAVVGEQLTENRQRARQRCAGRRHLLAGLACCGCCGYAYVAAGPTATNRASAVYRCTGTEGHRFGGVPVCDNRSVGMDQVEGVVWEEVQAVLADPTRLQGEYARRAEVAARGPETETVASLTAQIQTAQRGRARLIDCYAEGLLTTEDITPRLQHLNERIARLEGHCQAAAAAAEQERDLVLVTTTLETFAATVRDHLDTADAATKRTLMRALVKRVEIQRDEIVVVFRLAPTPDGHDPPDTGLPHWNRSRSPFPTPVFWFLSTPL